MENQNSYLYPKQSDSKKSDYYNLLNRAIHCHEVLENDDGFILISSQYDFTEFEMFHVFQVSHCDVYDKVIRIGIMDGDNDMTFSFLTKYQVRQLRDYLTQVLEEK